MMMMTKRALPSLNLPFDFFILVNSCIYDHNFFLLNALMI